MLSYFRFWLLGQGGSGLTGGLGLEGDGYFEKVAVQVELEFAALEFRKAFGNAKAKAAAFNPVGAAIAFPGKRLENMFLKILQKAPMLMKLN